MSGQLSLLAEPGFDCSADALRDCWATPPRLFDALHRDYFFTIDCCALAWNAKLPRYWTPEQDGLRQRWAGETIWCNPPYSNIEPWVAQAYNSRGEATTVMLLPARVDTWWWCSFAPHANEHCWFRGRPRFVPPPGVEASSGPFERFVLLRFGPRPRECARPTQRVRDPETGLIVLTGA